MSVLAKDLVCKICTVNAYAHGADEASKMLEEKIEDVCSRNPNLFIYQIDVKTLHNSLYAIIWLSKRGTI
jgi:hypothetical protein